ncbi:hypothetical protein ScPMuIL_018047 [Solemya velum]
MSQTSKGNERQEDDRAKKHGLRQRIPYKLFGKRLMKTGRMVVSNKVLQNAIPTRNCDILMTFPASTCDSTLMWLLARLRARTPQLIVHVRHHSNTNIYGFYMTATYLNLLRGAEELSIRKPLKMDYGGGMKEFTFEDQDCFAGVEEEQDFFTSQERQSIVHHMVWNLRAVEGEQLGKIKFLQGQSIVPHLESKGIISQVFPLHNSEGLENLGSHWVKGFTRKQPLDDVCEYFGVKIAMYFAYLGHYTLALCLPAFLGAILWILERANQRVVDFGSICFTLVNIVWATLYLEDWKRKSSEKAYKWGTLDKQDELLRDPRPLFTGNLRKSPVTGHLEPYYPAWKRSLFRYFISIPVIFLCLCVVFVVMLLIFQLQEFVNDVIESEGYPQFGKYLPKILLAIVIAIMDELYKAIAIWLNNMENYRMEESYENHLIIKLILFQFVNSFLSLFYIAFYLQDMVKLRDQLATLLITRQVVGNIKEVLFPFAVWKFRLYQVGYHLASNNSTPNSQETSTLITDFEQTLENKDDLDVINQEQNKETQIPKMKDKHALTQAEVESTMKKYDDTFEDYLEMFIQFGYVTLFSSAFPLAALCALLNNFIEVRSDAFKLCFNHQRPFGRRVENIGIWQDALGVMSIIAVLVNCAMICVSGQLQRIIPFLNTTSTFLIIVILEHVILGIKFCIAQAIPDVPEWVATEMAKWEFQRREALKRMESQYSTTLSASPDLRERIVTRQHTTPSFEHQTMPASPSSSMGPSFGSSRATSPTGITNRNYCPVLVSTTSSSIHRKSFLPTTFSSTHLQNSNNTDPVSSHMEISSPDRRSEAMKSESCNKKITPQTKFSFADPVKVEDSPLVEYSPLDKLSCDSSSKSVSSPLRYRGHADGEQS